MKVSMKDDIGYQYCDTGYRNYVSIATLISKLRVNRDTDIKIAATPIPKLRVNCDTDTEITCQSRH